MCEAEFFYHDKSLSLGSKFQTGSEKADKTGTDFFYK
jgi:hypothetical protein